MRQLAYARRQHCLHVPGHGQADASTGPGNLANGYLLWIYYWELVLTRLKAQGSKQEMSFCRRLSDIPLVRS